MNTADVQALLSRMSSDFASLKLAVAQMAAEQELRIRKLEAELAAERSKTALPVGMYLTTRRRA